MAHLFIRALGSLQVTLAGKPAKGFDSDKVRGLLSYLAVESDRPHNREKLAGLLWPEYAERSARTNLRSALANLRQVIGDHTADPPYLLITRQALQFNQASDHTIDVTRFRALVEGDSNQPVQIDQLEESVDLYKGAFLEGFSIPDSIAFEEWALVNRETLQMQLSRALHRLAEYYEGRGAYEKALGFALRRVEIDPYQEEAHRQVMQILANSGQRNEVLTHYENFRNLLTTELGVKPSEETIALYERIRAGKVEREVGGMHVKAVRGYELRDLLGTGQFGIVYRAFQPVVRRDVAVKIILPQFANQLDFIRRFEAEAQIVARLEHPHIVPLYDFWREPEGAYLVMRWLKGGNLSADLERGSWNPESAVRLVDQIAAALTVAHRQGVVHRDVKPANILLDEDGNAYLSDFGIASLTGLAEFMNTTALKSLHVESSGSLGYLSPEVALKGQVGVQTDIYSFGVVLYELLIGVHPFPEAFGNDLINMHLHETLPLVHSRNPELSTEVDAVIQRATAKDPRERYADPLALAEDFRLAVKPGVHVVPGFLTSLEETQNPYKGLRPFQEADAEDFFGRESLVERLLKRMGKSDIAGRFLAIVGPSGSGKSSVVKAGLIPALRKDALPGSGNWLVLVMTPGEHPLEELETALLKVAVNPPASLLEQLEDDTRGLVRAVKRSLPTEGGEDDQVEMILVVDQFEEVFTLTQEQAERAHFIDLLCTAVTDPGSQLRVVITLRADFYDRPLLYPEFGKLLHTHMETVLPLSNEELRQAIKGPAERVDLSISPGLVAAIQSDISNQPGFLPLLQYALTESFENREDNELTLAAYQKSGGVTAALARRAETQYKGLDKEGQEITRQVFLRLVTLGEGIEDTRRRMMLAELISLGDGSEIIESVLETFSRYRLLTLESHTDFIFRVDYSPDGKQLATASADGTAIVWDAITGEVIFTLSGHSDQRLWDVSFSPDGERLATSGDDGTVKIFDTGSGDELLALTGHLDWVTGIDFSTDGRWLASASFDANAIIWDSMNGESLFMLTGHTAPLWDVTFSPDGKHLASIDFGGTLKMWDVGASAAADSGVEVLSLDGYDLGPDLAYSPDGRYLAVTHADGTVRILVLQIEELVALAQERVTRSLTIEECQHYLHLETCPAEP